MTRPVIGTPNWGDELNTDLDGIEATALAAVAGVDDLADQVAALPATFASLNEDGELVVNGTPVGGSGAGGALVDRGIWTAATAYATGDVVSWQARRWCCGTAHTSASNFDTAKFADLGMLDPGFIVGCNQTAFGHSYVIGYASKLAAAVRTDATFDLSAGGARMQESAIAIEKLIGGPITGYYFNDCVINDSNAPLDASREASFINGLRTWLDFARAGSPASSAVGAGRLNTDSGLAAEWFTYVGTWTTTADANRSSGQRKATTTQNDTVNLRWYGDKVTVVLLGQTDGTGAAYTVTDPAGVTVASGSLSQQASSPFGPVPVRLSGFGPGWHDATLTKTDAGSTILALDCLLVPSPAPVATIVSKGVPVSTGINANTPAYNALVDAVTAEAFTSSPGAPVALQPSDGVSWTLDGDIDGGIHPTSAGNDKLWRRLLTVLTTLPYRPGLVRFYAPFPGPAPAVLADNFTRANSVFRPGSTSTGNRPWAVGQRGARFGITSNQLVQTQRGGYLGAVLVDCGKADTTVSWTIGALGASNVALCFRGTDNGTFLMISGGVLYKVTNSTGFDPVAAVTGAAPSYGAGDVIQAVCAGSSITLRKNGTDVATYTEATLATGTRYGMGNFDGMATGGLSAVSNT